MEELNECREIFSLFDREKTGEIHLNELGFIVRSLGYHPSEQRLKELQEEYGENSIDFQQFSQILICLTNEIDDEIDIIEAFRVFDKEGQGRHVFARLPIHKRKSTMTLHVFFHPECLP